MTRFAILWALAPALLACTSSQSELASEGKAFINEGKDLTTTAYRYTLEDGTAVWGVDCSGPWLNFGHRHMRAKYLCPTGYVLKEEKSSAGGATAVAGPYLGGASRSVDRSITIVCNQ